MTKRTKHLLITTSIIVTLIVVAIIGGAFYLIDYALKPGDRSRNEQVAWTEIDSTYPGMIAWRDSLLQHQALKDTTILAPDGAKMHAWYVYANRPTAATALLVHGYTDCSIRMMPLGRMYNRDLHMNILLPDLRNAGRTDGDHFQMGWFDRFDVKQWAALLPQIFGDSVRTVVHGVSMGAATTMMLSGDADVPQCVKTYIEDCGYTNVHDQFSKELQERFSLPSWPLIPIASTLCQWRYGWNFEEASALNQVSRSKQPMLFIHGTADKFVPTWMVHPLYRAKHIGYKEIWLAPHAEHARSYQLYPQEYTQRVKCFLQKTLH